MSYWKRVLRRVALEAAKDAKLDTVASATIHLVVQGVVSLIIWVALSHVLPPGTLWARILATAVPLLTFPIAMGVRFFTVPADMSREDKSEIEHLTSALETRERRKVVKAIVGRAIEEGERLLTRNSDGSLGSREAAEKWVTTTRNFTSAAFGTGEAALLLSDSGYTFYSSDGPVGIWIKGRLRRLTELLARVETLDIDKDFDLRSWR
jgi:hypothetical protein